MGRHKVISRFGLMHMVATNLCEWLYVLVEETKHEIEHLKLSKSGTFDFNFKKLGRSPKVKKNEMNFFVLR